MEQRKDATQASVAKPNKSGNGAFINICAAVSVGLGLCRQGSFYRRGSAIRNFITRTRTNPGLSQK